MNEIINQFKDGDSNDKLSIISNLLTIATTIITIVVGQVLTLKFSFNDYTFIVLAFYIGALALTCLAVYLFLKSINFTLISVKSFWLRLFFILISLSALLLLTTTIWSFVLTVQ